MRNHLPVFILTVALAAMTCVVGGCSRGGRVSTIREKRPVITIAMTDSSVRTVHGDVKRLTADIPRAATTVGWGVAKVAQSRRQHGQDKPEEAEPLRVHARIIIPDGREAFLMAQDLGDQRIEIALQVGQFGDPKQERLYLDALQKVLKDDPLPTRIIKFLTWQQ